MEDDLQALVFWYGSTLLRTQEYNITQFFICMMAVLFGAQGAGNVFAYAPDFTKAKTATIDLSRLLDHEPDIDVWSEKGRHVDVDGHIEFTNVYFSYPTRSIPILHIFERRPQEVVLKGLSFGIPEGQYVALVGPSGCGKSTVAALLERFYDPAAGVVSVDGISVSSYNLSEYRKNLAIVSQEPP